MPLNKLLMAVLGATGSGRKALKRAVGDLAREEADVALAMATANDGLWSWEVPNDRVFWSSGVRQLLGLDPAFMPSAGRWLELVHAQDLARYRSAMRRHFKGETGYFECEYRIRDATGSYRWILDRALALRDKKRRVYRVAGSVCDISDRKRAELAFRESEQRFRDIAEIASDWIWEMGPDLRFTYSTGYSRNQGEPNRESIVGRTRWEVAGIDPTLDERWRRHRADLEAHRPFRNFCYSIVRSDGHLLHLTVSGKPVFDEVGNFRGYRGTTSDITDQMEMRAQAASQAALIATTFETMLEGVLVIDADARIASFNPRFAEMLGLSRTDVKPGDSFVSVARLVAQRETQDQGRIEELVRFQEEQFKNRTRQIFEMSLLSGKILEVRANPVPGGGMVRTYIDVTERHRIEVELREALRRAEAGNRAKLEFLAVMSHELRTPLNAIIGFSDIMREQPRDTMREEQYVEYVKLVNESGRHLLSLIDGILDLSTAEAGFLKLHEEDIEVIHVLKASFEACKLLAESAGVSLCMEVNEPLPRIMADGAKLRQILSNLLSNAAKFTPAGGTITLRAQLDRNGDLILMVEDTGIGMDPEAIPTALQPFQQLDARLARKYEGAGIGLPLAKRLVELHGGSLTIDSAPGKGTTVTIRMPRARLRR